jgi:hypothetical protein
MSVTIFIRVCPAPPPKSWVLFPCVQTQIKVQHCLVMWMQILAPTMNDMWIIHSQCGDDECGTDWKNPLPAQSCESKRIVWVLLHLWVPYARVFLRVNIGWFCFELLCWRVGSVNNRLYNLYIYIYIIYIRLCDARTVTRSYVCWKITFTCNPLDRVQFFDPPPSPSSIVDINQNDCIFR